MGRSYGQQGETPVVPDTGVRFHCNLISTVTNRGKLYFQLFSQNFQTAVMLDFLERLICQIQKKVFLILDRHPVHLSAKLHQWLEAHADQIRLFFLPSYSPELNPNELLNHDVKQDAVGRKRAKTQQEFMANVRRHLRCRQHQPDVVQRFFHEPHVTYAAQ